MDEMTVLERFRAEVPRPGVDGLRAEEARLMAAIAGADVRVACVPVRRVRRGRLAVGVAGGLAAVSVAGVVVVAARGPERDAVTHVMPVAASRVLTRAADASAGFPELRPRAGQFLVYESQTMDPVESNSARGQARYLARSVRTVWLPVEGDATRGVIEVRALAPRPYPGWPIPASARRAGPAGGPERLADFDDRAEFLRNDFAYVSRLPTEPQKMYEHLYTRLGSGARADVEAWMRVGGLLTEAYLPAAQRVALYRAAAAIPGVTTVDGAVDAAGRAGVAAARTVGGVRREYIFDRRTYRYLGQREVVTDAALAQAPVGSVLTSTAQLRVSVADRAPRVGS